jgi:hypothetical protein
MQFDAKRDGYFQVFPQLDFDHGSKSDVKLSADLAIGVRYRF